MDLQVLRSRAGGQKRSKLPKVTFHRPRQKRKNYSWTVRNMKLLRSLNFKEKEIKKNF